MRFLALAVPALVVLTTACSRPEVEAFRRNPPPLEVAFEVPRGIPRPEAVKAEYAAALRARLATRTTVVRMGTLPPPQAVTVRVQITELRPVKVSDASPGAVGVATGIAVGTLSALAGNRDAVFDGFFWGLWAALFRRRGDIAAFCVLYAATLMIWAVNGKPVQFYYHYLLPGAFLMALLAFALDALWQRKDRWRKLATLSMAATLGMFVLFFPIISGLPLPSDDTYNFWMWLPSWR